MEVVENSSAEDSLVADNSLVVEVSLDVEYDPKQIELDLNEEK